MNRLRVVGLGAMTCMNAAATGVLVWLALAILKLGDFGVGSLFVILALLATCSWLMWGNLLDRELKSRR